MKNSMIVVLSFLLTGVAGAQGPQLSAMGHNRFMTWELPNGYVTLLIAGGPNDTISPLNIYSEKPKEAQSKNLLD